MMIYEYWLTYMYFCKYVLWIMCSICLHNVAQWFAVMCPSMRWSLKSTAFLMLLWFLSPRLGDHNDEMKPPRAPAADHPGGLGSTRVYDHENHLGWKGIMSTFEPQCSYPLSCPAPLVQAKISQAYVGVNTDYLEARWTTLAMSCSAMGKRCTMNLHSPNS